MLLFLWDWREALGNLRSTNEDGNLLVNAMPGDWGGVLRLGELLGHTRVLEEHARTLQET